MEGCRYQEALTIVLNLGALVFGKQEHSSEGTLTSPRPVENRAGSQTSFGNSWAKRHQIKSRVKVIDEQRLAKCRQNLGQDSRPKSVTGLTKHSYIWNSPTVAYPVLLSHVWRIKVLLDCIYLHGRCGGEPGGQHLWAILHISTPDWYLAV